MLVDCDLTKIVFNSVQHFFYLSLACLLEEHLAKEICQGVHHELVEGLVLEKKFLQYILDKLAGQVGPHLGLQLHFLVDLVLEHLAAILVSSKDIRLFDQEASAIVFGC